MLMSASLYGLLNQFNVDAGAFFGPKAVCAFHCCCSALFSIRKRHIFYWFSTTVKNQMEANMLVVWAPSS